MWVRWRLRCPLGHETLRSEPLVKGLETSHVVSPRGGVDTSLLLAIGCKRRGTGLETITDEVGAGDGWQGYPKSRIPFAALEGDLEGVAVEELEEDVGIVDDAVDACDRITQPAELVSVGEEMSETCLEDELPSEVVHSSSHSRRQCILL